MATTIQMPPLKGDIAVDDGNYFMIGFFICFGVYLILHSPLLLEFARKGPSATVLALPTTRVPFLLGLSCGFLMNGYCDENKFGLQILESPTMRTSYPVVYCYFGSNKSNPQYFKYMHYDTGKARLSQTRRSQQQPQEDAFQRILVEFWKTHKLKEKTLRRLWDLRSGSKINPAQFILFQALRLLLEITRLFKPSSGIQEAFI
ncbi:hypothetical protein CNMCM7691_009956 [Aspergillus felis]|nr:hypothetical protein CNMCM7691_009956 [Aspergillus felis]